MARTSNPFELTYPKEKAAIFAKMADLLIDLHYSIKGTYSRLQTKNLLDCTLATTFHISQGKLDKFDLATLERYTQLVQQDKCK